MKATLLVVVGTLALGTGFALADEDDEITVLPASDGRALLRGHSDAAGMVSGTPADPCPEGGVTPLAGKSFEDVWGKINHDANCRPVLTEAQLSSPLNAAVAGPISRCTLRAGTYSFNVVVNQGRAQGVTVTPRQACIDQALRGLSWTSSTCWDRVSSSFTVEP